MIWIIEGWNMRGMEMEGSSDADTGYVEMEGAW